MNVADTIEGTKRSFKIAALREGGGSWGTARIYDL